MEELLEKIKTEIEAIKKEEVKLEELTEKSNKLGKEEEQLKKERDAISDTESGFYQDVQEQVDKKQEEFTYANNARMHKENEIKDLIKEKKTQMQEEIANQKRYIDENRKVDLKGIDIDKLRAEKEKLDREIELNDITKEEFDKKTDSEKEEIRQAKQNYLNNKKRLNEINPKIQLIDTLDGKTPKERFMELDDLNKNIEDNFNRENFDNIFKNIKEKAQEKEETKEPEEVEEPTKEPETEQTKEPEEPEETTKQEEKSKESTKEPEKVDLRKEPKKTEEPVKGPEKVELGKEPKKTEEPTKEPDEEIRKKLEQIKKQTEKNNRDHRNINLNADPKIHKSQIKVPKENDKIVSIRINERSGIIYTKTESGKAEGIALAETMYHKKSLSAILKINEMCKEIAGGRIKGLLLGTKVNPAIVYALRKEPKQIENYITCLKEKEELPFELVHDLRDSSLSIMNRIKMWVHARAEDKLPGTKVILSERRWNKNKTIEAPKNRTKAQEVDKPFEMYKQVERDKNRPIADYYVDNKDNHIEKNATEKILKEQEEKRAKEVEKFMPDSVEDRNGNVVADFGKSR